MNAPRIEIRLDRITHNARTLVNRLALRGIAVTGVTKATLGAPEVARAMLDGGVSALCDARVENIEVMRHAGLDCEIGLVRSPMLGQVDRVVAAAETSHNTELVVVEALSRCAQRQDREHGVVLMVELGDLREGILPTLVPRFVQQVLGLPNLTLRGIGANLACQSGVAPDLHNMSILSALADMLETRFGISLETVSGGNSASIAWALGTRDVGRIDQLRLGEAILLGRDPLDRSILPGLHTDAFTLVAEVIECKRKPSRPWGTVGQGAFGNVPLRADRGFISQAIVALGRQDTDPEGLEVQGPTRILGASSDHLMLDAVDRALPIGAEVRFRPDYGALLRAMTSPFVERRLLDGAQERAAGPRGAKARQMRL